MPSVPTTAAVVAHDAGAANIILAWIDAGLVPRDRVYLEGPAAGLWDSGSRGSRTPTLEAALDGAEAVLTGTGWSSDLEHKARRMARERGLRSIAVIDHWVNYAARFTRCRETVLPDEIWITDEYAEVLARQDFPGVVIFRMPNLYLEGEIARIKVLEGQGERRGLLYVLEPARGDWARGTSGEFQALDYFIERMPDLDVADWMPVRLRPHPSDASGKYDAWIAGHRHLAIEIDRTPRLSDAIARANVVAGCNSFAMVVALEAGRQVVCTLPPWAPACFLPHGGLIHLKDLA